MCTVCITAFLFSTVSMDFFTELPLSNGFDAIAIFVDHDVTKFSIIVPCSSSITTDQTTTIYCNHVWKHFSLPHKLIFDCGTQFTSIFFTELCCLLHIDQG